MTTSNQTAIPPDESEQVIFEKMMRRLVSATQRLKLAARRGNGSSSTCSAKEAEAKAA